MPQRVAHIPLRERPHHVAEEWWTGHALRLPVENLLNRYVRRASCSARRAQSCRHPVRAPLQRCRCFLRGQGASATRYPPLLPTNPRPRDSQFPCREIRWRSPPLSHPKFSPILSKRNETPLCGARLHGFFTHSSVSPFGRRVRPVAAGPARRRGTWRPARRRAPVLSGGATCFAGRPPSGHRLGGRPAAVTLRSFSRARYRPDAIRLVDDQLRPGASRLAAALRMSFLERRLAGTTLDLPRPVLRSSSTDPRLSW